MPKSLFSDLYIDHKESFIISYLKKKLINSYYNNIINLDTIFFNSQKTKYKFLYIFPNLKNQVNLEVLYPFSNMEFIDYKKPIQRKIQKNFIL